MWLAGGWVARFGVAWPVGSVLRGSGWVRRVSAGLPSLGACALVLSRLGVLAPSPGFRGRVLSSSGACVVALAVVGVVALR